jgi:DnaK suppressor protein
MNTVEYWREKLLSEMQELETLSDGARESRAAVELDQQGVGRLSRMDAMQQQAMSVASERRRRMRIGQIEAAIKRLETDDFGYCIRCGEPIAEERITADPASTLCLECASKPRR